MEKNTVLICLIIIGVAILSIPPVLTWLFPNTIRALNRLNNRCHARIAAAQTTQQNINSTTTTIWTAVFIVFTTLLSLISFYLRIK